MGQENGWGWYAQVFWQHAFNSRNGYRPGDELDLSIGVHYDNLLNTYRIVPMLQLIGAFRSTDSGIYSDPDNTGYERIYVSPCVDMSISQNIAMYVDLRIPVMTHVRGYQLIAPALVNCTVSVSF